MGPRSRIDGTTDERSLGNAQSFLKEEELASRWRISIKALQRWRLIGDGPPFLKVGRSVRYRISDVEAFEAAALCGRENLPPSRQKKEKR